MEENTHVSLPNTTRTDRPRCTARGDPDCGHAPGNSLPERKARAHFAELELDTLLDDLTDFLEGRLDHPEWPAEDREHLADLLPVIDDARRAVAKARVRL